VVRPRLSRVLLSTSSDESNNTTAARPIHGRAVLGAGTMGHGIAQVAAAAGYVVTMRDVNPDALARGGQSIERNLTKAILGVTLGLEAMRMVEQGGASARDIDTAMELGYNHTRWGLCV
jgi:3-hydroxyacyl-CoA dehydrogenase